MDYGMAVSQKGYDVKTCADRFLSYSSAFQNLKIFAKYIITGPTTISHYLGYFAPFLIINQSTGQRENGEGTINILTITGTGVRTVYVFLDDFRTIEEKNINTNTNSSLSDNNYGIRISKEGFDVKSCEDKDLVFSSSFFTAIIHKKGIITSAGIENTDILHDLGYAPDCLSFIQRQSIEGPNKIISNDTTISDTKIKNILSTSSGDKTFFIIFKNNV